MAHADPSIRQALRDALLRAHVECLADDLHRRNSMRHDRNRSAVSWRAKCFRYQHGIGATPNRPEPPVDTQPRNWILEPLHRLVDWALGLNLKELV